MKYKPRLTAPAKNNKRYYSNSNAFYRGGFGMPNCTAYAHGRIAEITGKFPRIYGNAEDWYAAAQKNGYETGDTPRLGAIICWKAGRTGNGADGAGHVAVVEQIKPNGDIVVSASAWKSTEFYLTTLTKESGYIYDSTRPLLGFIYCGLEFDPKTEGAATETGTTPAAGEKVLLKDTPCYNSETAATSYGKKSGTYFLWDAEVRNGRVRITNSAARVGKAGQVTCWINAADAGLEGVAPVQPAEELEKQPEAGAKPESEVKAESAAVKPVVKAGDRHELRNVSAYSSATGGSIGTRNGIYYVHTDEVINGRVRMTNSTARVGVAGQVSFWVSVGDL